MKNNKGFWYVILVACIPVIVGSLMSGWVSISQSKATAINEITTNCAVMNEKISGNKELMLNLLAESEKRRTEQYQYLCGETQEIKDQLKQKKNISMENNELEISPDIEWISTRGGCQSKWLDTLQHYTAINDSLYVTLCLNLQEISCKLPQVQHTSDVCKTPIY